MDRKDNDFFSGEENPNSSAYVEECNLGMRNLNIYRLGHYNNCFCCRYEIECLEIASTLAEQSEL